jgi:hypothetical protein
MAGQLRLSTVQCGGKEMLGLSRPRNVASRRSAPLRSAVRRTARHRKATQRKGFPHGRPFAFWAS